MIENSPSPPQEQKYHDKISSTLQSVEELIYAIEKNYLEETMQCGNILKGWDFYISLKKGNDFAPAKA